MSVERASGRILTLGPQTSGGDDYREAEIELDPVSACPRCAEGRGCGAGVFGGPAEKRRLRLPVPDSGRFAEGDRVALEMPTRSLLDAALMAYGWPLAGLMSGAALAAALTGVGNPGGDGLAALLALAGLSLGLVLSRRQQRMVDLRTDLSLRPNDREA
ncbi:MAG: SoxR reducing system RseC family protein [Pseudomonadota bacterium]